MALEEEMMFFTPVMPQWLPPGSASRQNVVLNNIRWAFDQNSPTAFQVPAKNGHRIDVFYQTDSAGHPCPADPVVKPQVLSGDLLHPVQVPFQEEFDRLSATITSVTALSSFQTAV
ncbi:hypothetical protein [Faecalibaculum rodentium]|uniref:hypothetical protein n=1 Tax=Faecalibaculum rodentium TaxID=1702221 RepID=UPI003F67B55A